MAEQKESQLRIFKAILNLDLVHSDEGVNHLAEELETSFSATECAVFVYEREKKALRLLGVSSPDKSRVKEFKIRNRDFPRFDLLRQGLLVDIELDELDEKYRIFDSKYLIFFPTMDMDELIGAIMFGYDDYSDVEGNFFHYLELLRSIGKIVKLSIENRLLKENSKKLLSLTRLNEIANNAGENSDDEIETLYESTLEMMCEMLNVEYGSIWLKGDNEIVINNSYGFDESKVLRKSIPNNHGMVGWCFTNREPFLSISVKKDPRAALDMIDVDIKSAIAVPIYHEKEVYGVIILINRKDMDLYRPYKHFDEVDLALLEDIASRISLIISKKKYLMQLSEENRKFKKLSFTNQNLLEQQKEHVRLLKNITYITRAMRESYDIRNIQAILLLGVTLEEGLGFDRAMLLLKDEISQTLVAKYWTGIMNEEDLKEHLKYRNVIQKYGNFAQYLREKSLSINIKDFESEELSNRVFPYKSHAIFEKVVIRKKIVNIIPEIIEEWGNEYREISNLLGTEDFIVVPLVGRFETVGVLILDNKFTKREITAHKVDVLKIFADNAGLAIENVHNYEELRAKTISLERQTSLLNFHKEFTMSILESLDVAIIVLDRENKIREWNKKSEYIFNKKKKQVMGMGFEIMGNDFSDLINVADKVYEVKNTIVLNEYEFIDMGTGEKTFYDIKFTPLRSIELSRIEGIIVMFDDVTNKKLLEAEIRRQEKLASLGEMSARVAHEIRNPLSVIGGFTKRLEKSIDEGKTDKSQRYINIVQNEVERLEDIVNEILEFSRPNQKLEFENFSVENAVKDLLILYHDKIESKKIKLDAKFKEGEVYADKRRMKQALINLLQNAIEACEEWIGIDLEFVGNIVSISISNDGELMDEDIKQKIFSPFFTTKTTGTGLGLPITKKIIEEEHNGRLYIKTESHRDRECTVFVIEIPLDLHEE